MGHHPRWNFFDTAYGLAGVLIVAFVWGALEPEPALLVSMLALLSYAAGRTAGAHR